MLRYYLKKDMMSFGSMHRETMRGSNERVNYISMNGRSFFSSSPYVGRQKKEESGIMH